jgi:hypothetical protein
MIAQKIRQSKLSSTQIKHEDVDMVAQKIGQSKLASMQIKHEDTHTAAVTIKMQLESKLLPKNLALNNPLSKFNKSSR